MAPQHPTGSGSSPRTRTTPTGSRPSSRSPTAPGTPRPCRYDDHLAPDGRVMEILSEHTCQGWLEGYLLTGRHGFFSCYEAFVHVVDSMFNQHAKWLEHQQPHPVAPAGRVAELPAHLARLAAGPQRLLPPGPRLHRPRGQQEGRGDPGLPPAGRQHPAVGRRPLPAQPQYVNVIVAGKQPALQYLDMDDAIVHCTKGIGIWDWASTDGDEEPDVVMGCAGDVPDHGDPGRGRPAPRLLPRPEDPRRQRRRPDAAAGRRASTRTVWPDADFDALFTTRQAGDLRLPRLPVADPPAHLPAHQPRQLPRPRLQGGRHHHHAVRHDACSTRSTASTSRST